MVDIESEYARIESALGTPTLRLLDRKWAPFALPIFSLVFPDAGAPIPVEQFHSIVTARLDDLRAAGHDVPPGDGKAAATQWVNQKWLYRDPGEQETYQLTGDARSALDYVARVTRVSVNVSLSRVTTMMDVVSRAALAANPDVEERKRRLKEEIQALQDEYHRLNAGGELEEASESELTEQFQNVLRELDGLPSDFRRVEEAVMAMHRTTMRGFQIEDRPLGEVLDDYLDRSSSLMSATPEGKAFEGALELLRNPDWMGRLKSDLDSLLQHPWAGTLLPNETRQLRTTIDVIKSGINDVLSQRHRLSAMLREHIENYDHVRNRALDATFKAISIEMREWMQTARPRDHVEIELIPQALNIETLKLRVYDPANDRLPEPLADRSDQAPDPISLDELRKWGGPSLQDLRLEIASRLNTTDAGTAASMFNELPDELRRPVELIGLLHVLTDMDADLDTTGRELVTAVRPDGTHRDFFIPAVDLATGSHGSAPEKDPA